VEGRSSDPRFKSPLHAYGRGSGTMAGCAVVGGTFYNPRVAQFPAKYVGKYFFADHCNGWINYLDPDDPRSVVNFASGITRGDRVGTLDLDIGPDGSLYYLLYNGSLFRIFHGSGAPSLTEQPEGRTVSVGEAVTFRVKATGDEPLGYQWRRNGADIPGASGASYTIPAAALADDGARFRCRVSNAVGTAASNEAVLRVTTDTAPSAEILTPPAGAHYAAGTVIGFSGSASDAEDGPLPAGAFTWWVDFHHNSHVHAFLPESRGSQSGAFTVPDTGEKATDVWYRIYLRVRDSGGLTHTTFRDVLPELTSLTLTSSPAGLQVAVDGQPRTAPHSFPSVVGMRWTIAAPSPQSRDGVGHEFRSWSDGGAAEHEVVAPAAPAEWSATFAASGAATVFADDFEADRGWTRNAGGNDTAADGLWERGDPEPTSSGGTALQPGRAARGSRCLVTGRTAGGSAAANDIDGGVTSIRSPAITLPEGGRLTLSFSYVLAHLADSSPADFFKVSVVGPDGPRTVFQEQGAAGVKAGAWVRRSVEISRSAGQTVRLLIEAADAGPTSVLEAALDDVTIVQGP